MSEGTKADRPKQESCRHTYDTIHTIPADLDTTISVLQDANAEIVLMMLEVQEQENRETPTSPQSLSITEQIEAKIHSIMHTDDWVGGCALEPLRDHHMRDFGRKWGPNGVFQSLRRFYPECLDELGADYQKHLFIISLQDAFNVACTQLRNEGERLTRAAPVPESKPQADKEGV